MHMIVSTIEQTTVKPHTHTHQPFARQHSNMVVHNPRPHYTTTTKPTHLYSAELHKQCAQAAQKKMDIIYMQE